MADLQLLLSRHMSGPWLTPMLWLLPTCSGRKKAALLYVILYVLSCATKHSPDYWVLMFGRFLGGIATSLLFSAFESWVVAGGCGWVSIPRCLSSSSEAEKVRT
jgi:hypothetical protein